MNRREDEMYAFNRVSRHYGTQDVLTNVTCEIHPGERVGLIGRNGAGKTTLVRILSGEEEPSEGSVIRPRGARISVVPQHVEPDPRLTVEQYMLDAWRRAETRLREAEERIASVRPESGTAALSEYQAARDAWDEMGGEELPRRAAVLLERLGLEAQFDRSVSTLSGGERNVLSLARAVLSRPTLLILDEPGNHLDFDGLARLETYLQEFDGILLVVSHNRYLLDRVVTRIFELEGTRLTCWDGNYSQYRMTRLRKLVAQQADYAANQKRLAQLEALVERFAQIARSNPSPAWGKRLHARKTQLRKEKGRAVDKPVLPSARISIGLGPETTRADIALQVKGYTRGFGKRVLFRETDLTIACAERVALVGPNGSGKTTFLRDVVEKGSWESATIRVGPSLRVGYCAQHQELLDPSRSILEEFQSLGAATRREAFAAVARFLFTWEDLDKRIADLSGGERNRLQLARVILLKASFLVLDEPTNHMDIASREAIEDSLAEFRGTVLLVSHDRYLLDKVATRIVTIEDESFVPFPGSFSEFWATRAPARPNGGRTNGHGRKRVQGRERAGRAARPADISAIERRITEQEAEKLRLESLIAQAITAADHQRGKGLAARLDRTTRLLDDLYRQWGELG
jgi:ATP-binding cassette subfamily F protein 3